MKLRLNAPADPRWYQIAVLGGLLSWGVFVLHFDVTPARIAAVFAAALATQAVCGRIVGVRFDWKSPAITALSLALLLRADSAWPLALAAAIAIGAKFTLRIRGRHVFNPANLGIVVIVLLTDAAWTSPGQWGAATAAALVMAIAGLIVATRAARADVPLIFLATYAGLLFGRALWLGDPMAIPTHQLQNGAILLFAFHMISDPKTTPDRLGARIAFVAATALLAFVLRFNFFVTDGLFYALALTCLARPFIAFAYAAARRIKGFAHPASQIVPATDALQRSPSS